MFVEQIESLLIDLTVCSIVLNSEVLEDNGDEQVEEDEAHDDHERHEVHHGD